MPPQKQSQILAAARFGQDGFPQPYTITDVFGRFGKTYLPFGQIDTRPKHIIKVMWLVWLVLKIIIIMTRLLEYLDVSGWKQTKKGTRTTVKDAWAYDWRVRGDLTDLWKWKPGKTGDTVQIFVTGRRTGALKSRKK
jgi:hypothetical protein